MSTTFSAGRRTLTLGFCLAALALVACGGASSFASQADGICKSANQQGKAIGPPTSTAQVAPYIDQILALFQKTDSKLKALNPPSDKRAGYQDYLASLDRIGAALLSADTAAHAGKVTQAASIIRQESALNASVKAKAKALGLNVCGQ